MSSFSSVDVARLQWKGPGETVTVVAQDAVTGAVLMVAGMNLEALEMTLATGEMHYLSRTRGLWRKGATSGNVQRVVSLTADCDGDALLARVRQEGPACHLDRPTCFGDGGGDVLSEVAAVIEARAEARDEGGYTRQLLDDRNLRLKKIAEESGELAVACADGDSARAREETADLLYHVLVALQPLGVTLDDVRRVLAERRRA